MGDDGRGRGEARAYRQRYEAMVVELQALEAAGVREVVVIGEGEPCAECRRRRGLRFPIQVARNLPVPGCHDGACTCRYAAAGGSSAR